MHEAELFLTFTRPLDDAGIPYMVSGSVASMVYGEPRMTNDVDLIVDLQPHHARILQQIFPLDGFYCPPEEVIIVESRRSHRGHFNLIHHDTGHKADMYTAGDDPLQAWGLERRRQIPVTDDHSVWIAPPEYVILRKLEYYRESGSEKHRLDIKSMFEVSSDLIDTDTLQTWIKKLNLSQQWSELSSK